MKKKSKKVSTRQKVVVSLQRNNQLKRIKMENKIAVTFEVCAKESKSHLFYFDAICSNENEIFTLLAHYKNWYHYNHVRLVSF